MNRAELAGRIDHTILKADTTTAQIRQVCEEALRLGCASVCVNSSRVALVTEVLSGSDTVPCAVVGFPLGAMSPESKTLETALAVAAGAREIDMVLHVGALKDGDHDAVRADIAGVVGAAGDASVKVILETCLLTDDEKRAACTLAVEAGAAYVKTSTGFSTSGATIEDVALMRAAVGDRAKVKASGGIRDTATALKMIEAGADRLGLSASVAIVEGLPE